MLEIIKHKNKKVGTIDHECLEIRHSEDRCLFLMLPEYLIGQSAEVVIRDVIDILQAEGVEVHVK